MAVNTEIFDEARFAKAGFFGAARMVLAMHAKGQIGAESAIRVLSEQMEEALPYTIPAEKLLKQLVIAISNKELGLDDVPPL